jgi:uracil-DNA glycosylase family 4
MSNSIYVPGCGNSSAKLLICGEAPGAREEETGLPFSGPAGYILSECLEANGIDRNDVYITNVVKIRPPNNKIKDLHLIGHKIEEFIPQLIDEINTLNPNCILALGNTALNALTGESGIEKFRGSILRCKLTGHKVVASIHPAALLHDEGDGMKSWKDVALIKHDIARAKAQSAFPEINWPKRTLQICRSSSSFLRFLDTYNSCREAACDIETSKTIPVAIGFAFNNWHAISIPLLDKNIPEHDLTYIWKLLAEFLHDNKVKFIAQNGKFDTKRCRNVGLKWHDLYFDTMLAWHTLFSEMPKKLAVISSILTEEPYYKDEGSEYNPKKDSFDRILLYNAKDCAVEFEVYEKEMAMLEEEPELYSFFFDKIMPLHQLYSDMEDIGFRVDYEVRKFLKSKYKRMQEEKYEKLVNNIIDKDETLRETFRNFNPNSPKQVANLVYGYLRCPARKDTGEDTLKSLVNNSIKDQRRKDILEGILEQRKIRKSISTYIEAAPSDDKRIRTECMICGTETGRTSTQVRKPPIVITKEGMALQTMTKHGDVNLDVGGDDLRAMFISDDNWSFIEPDLSQAEDRVVCVLSKDWLALKEYDRKEFKRNKHGLKDDRHTLTAINVSSLAFDDVTDYDRQIAKKTRHAANYAMGKHQFMLNNAKYGLFISEWKCGELLKAFHASNPQIKEVFHVEIQKALAENNCILYSPQYRKRQFFNKWGDELFKEAYSYIPQATVSDQVKFAMFRIKSILKDDIMFQLESHDSFCAMIRDNIIKDAAMIIKKELEQPISFKKCTLSRDYELIIPCEMKTGKRWIESNEYKDGMVKYVI